MYFVHKFFMIKICSIITISSLQFINIVVNLLDALKTSFSHRSMSARSLGKKDTMSDAAVASLSMFKVK